MLGGSKPGPNLHDREGSYFHEWENSCSVYSLDNYNNYFLLKRSEIHERVITLLSI